MKSVWKLLLVGVGAFILVFVLAMPVLAGLGWGGCGLAGPSGFGPGMMGYGGYGWNMMGGGVPMMGFGFLGMFTMLLVPLAVVVLGVVGIAALVRSLRANLPAAAPVAAVAPAVLACTNCGKSVESGWIACPHCGQKL
jgi:hypothetical protein